MKPWIKYFLVGLVAFIVGAAAAGGDTSTSSTETVTETQSVTAEAPAETTPEVPAPAEIKSDLNCDYNISTAGTSGGFFIAGGTVSNDGGKAARVTVKARWTLLGSNPARSSKTVRVAPGREREVQLSVPASIDQIGMYQSGNTKCKVSAR